MKHIPPAIQEEERYLRFRVHGEEKDIGDVVDAVWKSATVFMGTKGVSKADIWTIGNKFDTEEQRGIIKVHKEKVSEIRAALTINSSFDDDSFISIEKVSGTIAALED